METIAPDSKTSRSVMWVFAGFAIVGAALTVAGFPERGGSPAAVRPLVYGLVSFCLGVLGSAYLWLWRRNSRLLVSVDRFGFRDAFGRDHVWSRADVGRVVDLSVRDSQKSPPRRAIYFLRPDGSRLFIVGPSAWSEDAIDRMARATGRPRETPPTMTRAEFVARFPGATTLVGRHPNLFVFGGVAAAVAIGLALTFVHL